jgi:transposase InsO family protein
VYPVESGEYAAELLKRTVLSERCWQEPLVLHADNGAPMKSQVLQVKLAELKITPSHSRLWVSNDNARVGSLFRTLKYLPAWPEKGFATLEGEPGWKPSSAGTTRNIAIAVSGMSRRASGTEAKTASCWQSENRCMRQQKCRTCIVGQGQQETGIGRTKCG